MTEEWDVAVIGGSLGGVAAALAAAEAGARVILTEENAWIGGQVTSQAVSALDEYPWVEQVPASRSYADFRIAVRKYYQDTYQAPAVMPDGAPLNPGHGWVSRLCFEPQIGLFVLNEMLAPHIRAGRMKILLRRRPVRCEGDPTHIRSVEICSPRGKSLTVRAQRYIDATDLGDLLPLAGVPYTTGAEAFEDTREPHASLDGPHPERVQSFTFCFLVQFCQGENHTIRKPRGYETFRRTQPYSLTLINHQNQAVSYNFFNAAAPLRASGAQSLPFWTYRRVFDAALLGRAEHQGDIVLINWPSNDYRWGNIIDQSAERKAAILDEARRLSLGFLYWLHTEAARDDGLGQGYPELKLLRAAVGTRSGIAQAPYVRESRRIISLRRIYEQEITTAANPGKNQAAFADSVGIGSYAMDLHACVGDKRTMFAATLPFQIPLGSLIPLECDNLIAACKNIGTTHLTNGCFRLHPVEWSIGEAAGALGAYTIQNGCSPRAVWSSPSKLGDFQETLRSRGVRLAWPEEIFTGTPG